MVEGYPLFMHLGKGGEFSKQEIVAWAKEFFGVGSVVFSGGLHCFTWVEVAGCSYQAITTSGGASSMKSMEVKGVNTMIGNIKNTILWTYHSIKENHIPRYFAELFYRFNRRFCLGKRYPASPFLPFITPMPQRLLRLTEIHW